MPDRTAAERFLELVTTPEKAQSITGDLLEYTGGRRNADFWLSILRIAACQLCRDIYDAPLRMLWLAFFGFIEWVTGSAIFGIVLISLWVGIAPYQTAPHSYYIPPWADSALFLTFRTVAPFVVGWDVARRSKGRHVAAGLALISLWIAGSIADIAHHGALNYRFGPYPRTENVIVTDLLVSLSALAGAIYCRLRAAASDQGQWPLRII